MLHNKKKLCLSFINVNSIDPSPIIFCRGVEKKIKLGQDYS